MRKFANVYRKICSICMHLQPIPPKFPFLFNSVCCGRSWYSLRKQKLSSFQFSATVTQSKSNYTQSCTQYSKLSLFFVLFILGQVHLYFITVVAIGKLE